MQVTAPITTLVGPLGPLGESFGGPQGPWGPWANPWGADSNNGAYNYKLNMAVLFW